MSEVASDKLVSVVTPTFNRADYLPGAIDSVLSQTVDNFELIIVDDGSSDGTRELVEGYQAEDSRIRYFYQENQGQSVARNRGIEEARGEFICFLDSDNAWFPHKIERSLAEFEQYPESDIVYGDYVVIDRQGNELGENRVKRYSGFIAPQLLRDNFVSMNTTMTRKSCFEEMGGFDEADRYAEDYGLWLRFSTRYRFRYLADLLAYYRVMEDQISSQKATRLKANENLLMQFLDSFPDVMSPAQKRRGLSQFYLRKARFEGSQKQLGQAFRDIGLSLRHDPLWQGPWKTIIKITLGILPGKSG